MGHKDTTVKRYKEIIKIFDTESKNTTKQRKEIIYEISDRLLMSPRTIKNIVYDSKFSEIVNNDNLG